MNEIENILQAKIKPKEKQVRLVKAVVAGKISSQDFMEFFKGAKDTDKGSCADAMKHISVEKPDLLAPYIDRLIGYINHPLPRVKWGVSETIGNLAKDYPDEAIKAILNLLKNTTDNETNTTVIRWCAAYALTEIAKHNIEARKSLVPIFDKLILREKNNGVKNVYIKALKAMGADRIDF